MLQCEIKVGRKIPAAQPRDGGFRGWQRGEGCNEFVFDFGRVVNSSVSPVSVDAAVPYDGDENVKGVG